ncbi:LOW QUALITY PROTEIN: putative coiled-coil domain-containing protein 144 N-terminal-like [Symphalangus syndactylus]|uniref:LOW QUALITY PROTEIN: putative coiled-coil domain-containing protein 144 N-terminal-like n=1 Tax=Symphalangus syndactylus TaxID=9590 RepID=UPI002442C179|nr:LOW QUALITY PROTEIN: putative coiled-coil domain-containing protein 144 N-terminal-like [Symphalangus syndactylus]
MASRGGENGGGAEGSPKPAASAMRKTPSVGNQEDQLSLSSLGDRWSSDSFSWLSKSDGSDSEHDEGALDQPWHDVLLEDLGELHRGARSGVVPGVERVLAPGDPGVDKRDRKESISHLIPEYKTEQTPESLPQNNDPALRRRRCLFPFLAAGKQWHAAFPAPPAASPVPTASPPKPGESCITESSCWICCAMGLSWGEPSLSSPGAGSTLSVRLTSQRSSGRGRGVGI